MVEKRVSELDSEVKNVEKGTIFQISLKFKLPRVKENRRKNE